MPESNDTTWYADGLSFECTQCGNCCTGPPGYVWFDDAEARTIADRLGLSEEQFRDKYAHVAHGRWTLNEVWNSKVDGYDCVFLERDPDTGKALCSIYQDRPTQCRTWPFWPSNLRSRRNWRGAARDCPGMDKGNFYPIEKIRILRDQTSDT
jgi:Fe-S-cluster containining protein